MGRETRLAFTWVSVLAATSLLGCDDADSKPTDGAVLPDARRVDAGPRMDSGATDSGQRDSGSLDSGRLDSGGMDSGRMDAGRMDSGGPDSGPGDTGGTEPVVVLDGVAVPARGGTYFGFRERFNRYYTDRSWRPSRTVYVSAGATGDGSSREMPANATRVAEFAQPGTMIVYLPGTYNNYCARFVGASRSGTYDQPVVLRAERGPAGEYLAHLNCCSTARSGCFDFEGSHYIAVDGFELQGGDYGVRSVGTGFAAQNHAVGIAVMNTHAFDQLRDPLFTGEVDWSVWESNVCHGAGARDGHGIYLSNGSDWNIVRYNELYDNRSSDFQINADPEYGCLMDSIPVDDVRCYSYAGEGEGGRGVSDYILVEDNFFHHGRLPDPATGYRGGSGPNFTSVRRSVVRNNIIGPYPRHGTSFWQEHPQVPQLGSRENRIYHNIFVATSTGHMLQFIRSSTYNDVRNNIFLGLAGGAVWMNTDGTVTGNIYAGNVYIAGLFEGFEGSPPRVANSMEMVLPSLDRSWFQNLPTMLAHDPRGFAPTSSAPFLNSVTRLGVLVPLDREGTERADPTEPGPYEVP